MKLARADWSRIALAAGALAAAAATGFTWPNRMSNPDGYYLVAVDDPGPPSPPPRPRHTVVVLIDGLTEAAARSFHALDRLRPAGQCLRTDVGAISISRPVYAVISSGLEQARTGIRDNPLARPAAVESIWEVARRAGLDVRVYTHHGWSRLFPRGFDREVLVQEGEGPLAMAEPTALTLVHPVSVDSEGHAHGAASEAYRAEARRLDAQLERLLDRVDLAQDLVVFTADHGHAPGGGHGGRKPDVATVLTCFAGQGVRRSATETAADSRVIAPALSVLLGLPFPRHLRAGEDVLDEIWPIVDLPQDYLRERRATVERFREENARAVGAWLGRPRGEWSELEARGRRRQQLRGAPLVAAALIVLVWWVRRRGVAPLAALAVTLGGAVAQVLLIRGSFDLSLLSPAIPYGCIELPIWIALGLLWWWATRDRDARRIDQTALVLLALLAVLWHPLAYGWTLGYPLPGSALLFFPFFSGLFAGAHAILLLAVALLARRTDQPPTKTKG